MRKIDLMGWSWGTTIMGMYTADHNENVNKLVLYALSGFALRATSR